MSIVISISCDYDGCHAGADTSTDMDSGVNEIEAVLDDGWVHDGSEDYCPEHADAAEGGGL